jgi:predicted metal-dependent hydrolase
METIVLITILLIFVVWYCWKCINDELMEKDPIVVRIKSKLIPFFPELRNVKFMKGTSSYTINKQKIYLCTDHSGTRYDDNMLIYVTLHELAHVITPEIGHGPKFVENFNTLLDRAIKAKLYDPNQPKVENYCRQT